MHTIRLSADRINRKSPYWVIQLDELTFRFVTRNGIIYRVGFYKDQYFLGNRAYHFFIANDSEANPPKDSDVFRVITCVLEEGSTRICVGKFLPCKRQSRVQTLPLTPPVLASLR